MEVLSLLHREQMFLHELNLRVEQAKQYNSPSFIQAAKEVIPLEKLTSDAGKKPDGTGSDRDELARHLLRWFKLSFFQWVDFPDCQFCSSKTQPIDGLNGGLEATAEEKKWSGHRVEGYQCTVCSQITRFPRYNNPVKLLETRRGRCGEWANCFTLCAWAAGFEARIAFDESDHVWTEIWSDSDGGRWIHCDACENAWDTPLVYEDGWGKQLSYVLAFSPYEVVDVSWRYSRDHPGLLQRRLKARESRLSEFIWNTNQSLQQFLSPQHRNALRLRLAKELVELISVPKKDGSHLPGRKSGSEAWRRERGELGNSEASACTSSFGQLEITRPKSYVFKPSAEELDADELIIRYSAVTNQYVRPNIPETSDTGHQRHVKDWKSCSYSYENIERKEELDWKMVYLARIGESDAKKSGNISWKVDLSSVKECGKRPVSADIQLPFKTFSDEAKVVAVICSGDSCKLVTPDGRCSLDAKELEGCKAMDISVTLSGGQSWQHAQLVRNTLKPLPNSEQSEEQIMQIKIAFESS